MAVTMEGTYLCFPDLTAVQHKDILGHSTWQDTRLGLLRTYFGHLPDLTAPP